ncbi:MAG: CFI-box-CTERM domain-containing protein [Thermodesulfobacteriota bacterium]
MISFPYIPKDGDPLATLIDDLENYDKSRWRFFRYDPAQAKYLELTTPDWIADQNLDYGRGYWIISNNPTEICIEGMPVPEDLNWTILDHKGDGWNQIGNIFDYGFPIAGLYVARGSTPLDLKQLIDGNNNNLTYVTLQDFENGSYTDIPTIGKSTLEAGKGYWLRVKEGVGEDVILWFLGGSASALFQGSHLSEGFLEKVVQQEDPPDPPPDIEDGVIIRFRSDDGGTAGCIVVASLYRKYDHLNVQLMRRFRDQYLLANKLGRTFVSTYYKCSPPLADYIGKHPVMRQIVRIGLYPVMTVGKYFVGENPSE